MRLRKLILSIAAWVIPCALQAQYPDSHGAASVSCDADGDFVVVWQNRGLDGDGYGVFGQRYDSGGAARGSEFQVNSYTTDIQLSPSVCTDSGGDFVVAWQSYGQDGSASGIFARRFASSGTPGSEFQVNTYTSYIQGYPAVSCQSDGDFVVAWTSELQDGDYYGIVGRRFDSAGAPRGTEFQVNTYTTYGQVEPAITTDALGNFVVAWSSYDDQDGSTYGVFGQRFDSAGGRRGTEFQINTYTTNSQLAPAVASDLTGNFVVAWSSSQAGDDAYGVFGQRYDASGAPAGDEFHVNTYTTGDQGVSLGFGHVVAVAGDAAGQFVVVWQSTNINATSQDGDGAGIFGQRFGGAPLAPVGTEFQVNSTTSGNQAYPAVCRAASGSFVVVWENNGNDAGDAIFGQRFDSTGALQGSEFKVSSDTAGPAPGCIGDCNDSGEVTVDELVRGVNILLEVQNVSACPSFDADNSGTVTVNELVSAVNAVLGGCAEPVPTNSPRPTNTPDIEG